MRVLLLNYEFPPMGGGAGNATRNIARELAAMAHQVSVLTSRHGDQPRHEVDAGVKIDRVFSWRKGIHDCGIRGAWSFVASAIPRLRAITGSQGFEVCHYFFTLPTGALSLVPGRHRSLPGVVSLRGSDVPYYDEFNPVVHRLNLMLRPLIRRIWRRAGRVVALSAGLRNTARRTDRVVRIDVIPNGVETELFSPGERDSERASGPLRLITVSRLIRRKGIDHLLRAVAAIRAEEDVRLTVVGTGSHHGELQRLSTELGLDDVVAFAGYHPREELPALYRSADVFVLPSLAESFGLVFAEAMACGLPVIAGRTGGVPDLVKPDNGILVEPGNIGEIADALRALGASPERRAEMSRANRKKVETEYGWRSVAERYLQVYQEIAGGRKPISASGRRAADVRD